MIVYVNPAADDAQRAEIQNALTSLPQQVESFDLLRHGVLAGRGPAPARR